MAPGGLLANPRATAVPPRLPRGRACTRDRLCSAVRADPVGSTGSGGAPPGCSSEGSPLMTDHCLVSCATIPATRERMRPETRMTHPGTPSVRLTHPHACGVVCPGEWGGSMGGPLQGNTNDGWSGVRGTMCHRSLGDFHVLPGVRGLEQQVFLVLFGDLVLVGGCTTLGVHFRLAGCRIGLRLVRFADHLLKFFDLCGVESLESFRFLGFGFSLTIDSRRR